MVDRLRYLLAVLNLIVLPSGVLFWSVIHYWARSWRKLGPARTYAIVLPVLAAFGASLFRFRRALLGTDFGTNRILIAVALVLCGVMTWLDLQYWRQLTIATLVGIPELSSVKNRQGRLLRAGIYRVVRHPRYLSAGIGVIAGALIINHEGIYLLIVCLFPAGYMMVMLEERELVDRFGEEYRTYQREVPRIVPRVRRRGISQR